MRYSGVEMQSDKALTLLKQGAAEIISEDALREKLMLGRPLRVKLGVDPTTSDIHLGHTVVLRKLRQFQDRGHQAVLIIGDFTGMVGDPSGRSVTRPQLTYEQISANAATYREQAFKILDPERTETVCNGDWFRTMSFEEVIRLNSRVTLQQMLQREDFRARIDNQQPIRAHEIQYPIMQGWDSVMVKADVELGGTDQLFNILIGRDFQREEGLPQQVVFLLPILEGLDGARKMSKSLGNFIGIDEPAADMFGKLMSISDELMARYYEVLLGRTVPTAVHPLEAKKQLAFEIVQTYHSVGIAHKVLDEWNTRFSKRDLQQADLPGFSIGDGAPVAAVILISNVYREVFKLDKSRSEISRLIKQGSAEVDGAKIQDPRATIALKSGQILRLDRKHAVRIE
ncbi:MAG TPA: tyrosine--tRNA ligase [Candidatus Udaeobacter sp.]|jgi:tyrosyl-tRNA synthetase|nr:tyrosine--tRNA ligase [Candidatus Udaeobacter sp.]